MWGATLRYPVVPITLAPPLDAAGVTRAGVIRRLVVLDRTTAPARGLSVSIIEE